MQPAAAPTPTLEQYLAGVGWLALRDRTSQTETQKTMSQLERMNFKHLRRIRRRSPLPALERQRSQWLSNLMASTEPVAEVQIAWERLSRWKEYYAESELENHLHGVWEALTRALPMTPPPGLWPDDVIQSPEKTLCAQAGYVGPWGG
ncbi:hypothetical protein BV20DRAFT_983351, partial [Pilatotrama ljubarskyi]